MMQGSIPRLRDGSALVCRVQPNLGIETTYSPCAPGLPLAGWGALAPKLHISLHLEGVPHVIVMSQMVALPSAEIGPVIGNASDQRDEIVDAIDLLVSGF